MTIDQEKEHLKSASHSELCKYLAAKIRRARTQRMESQEAFAARAGIALRTYKRLETDGRGHLDTFLKAMIALEYVPYLPLLFPVAPTNTRINTLEGRIAELQEKQKRAQMGRR